MAASEEARRLVGLAREVSGSVVGDDEAAALKIRGKLEKAYDVVENAADAIDAMLSDFNSPGLRAAFLAGLKAGIDRRGFMSGAAKRELAKWFRSHGD